MTVILWPIPTIVVVVIIGNSLHQAPISLGLKSGAEEGREKMANSVNAIPKNNHLLWNFWIYFDKNQVKDDLKNELNIFFFKSQFQTSAD